MRVHVAAYAAVSPAEPWDSGAEAALYDALERAGAAGLELPFDGRLHAHDDAWLVDRLRPDWTLVLTPLPGVMKRLASDPVFGLASPDEAGRRRALDFLEEARLASARLARRRGAPVVRAVQLHSAPRGGSPEAFARSLAELRARDWGGATLLVEHCDALLPGREPAKGFLRLEDELAAVAAPAPAGAAPAAASINWGRSAIETRSAEGALAHVRLAAGAGLLGGLFFSGATASDPDYGAWEDRHAPFSTTRPSSLLTPEAAAAALAAAGPPAFVGLKVQPLPASLGPAERLRVVADGLAQLGRASAARP